ncbi:hypothetical protein [Salinigranum salinum]|uniref:hypothetical protein n=1 Tax=Salinigranum salinum TaxID=1364937 RepID=UPI0012605309|nr:hypothetical protein [Salinigranum salinum]
MARVVRRVVAVVVGVLLLAGRATAHDPPDTRFDAPIPLELLLLGAAAAVGLTALVLTAGTDASLRGSGGELARLPVGVVRSVLTGSRLGFFALVAFALVAAVFGPVERNLATPFVWAVWFKGVGLLAAIVGNPWPTLSPWETVARGVTRLRGGRPTLSYPAWLGSWPALVGVLLLVGVVENLTRVPDVPRETAGLVGGYAALTLAGGLVFGRTWFRRADCFDVLYGLFGRVAPVELRRTEDTTCSLRWRPPWEGCTTPVTGTVAAAIVVAAVYIVSFDGVLNTIQYQYFLVDVGVLLGTGVGVELLTFLGGYLLFVAGFVVLVGTSELVGGRDDVRGALAAFAPTVLPIAVAYEVAHTYPFVLRGVVTVGATLVGVPPADPIGWLSVPAFWASQVVLITVGHVVAVVASHVVTAQRYATARSARRAHLPLTVLMMGYTVLSLWIISLPVVR